MSIVYVLIVLFLMGILIYVSFFKTKQIGHDYAITFKDENDIEILNNKLFKSTGQWQHFGKGYRGKCEMNKDELAQFIQTNYHLSSNQFEITNMYSGMHFIR